jgi:hypothetical protein
MSIPAQVRLISDSPLGHKGQVVTLDLKPGDVFTPAELPTYVAGFKNAAMRAEDAAPVVLVDREEGTYRSISADSTFMRVNVKGAPDGAPANVSTQYVLSPYKLVWRFLGDFISDTVARQSPRDEAMISAGRIGASLMLDREFDTWALLGAPANWNSDQRLALSGSQNWGATPGAGSDPMRDLDTAMQASIGDCTDIWFNSRVAAAFLRHDKVRDMARFRLGDSALGPALARATRGESFDFEMPGYPACHIVGARAINDAGTLDYVMPDVAVLTRSVAPSENGSDVGTAQTFRLRGPSKVGYEARSFRVENIGPLGGTAVTVAVCDQLIMTSNKSGGIISGVLA